MKEEKIRPSLRYVPTDISGKATTFILLLTSILVGTLIPGYMRGYGNATDFTSPDFLLGIFLILASVLIMTILIHLPLELSIVKTVSIVVTTYVILCIYTYFISPNGGESPIALAVVAIPFVIIAFLIISIIFISIIFRWLKNRFGALGTTLSIFLTLIVSIMLSS